MPDFIPVYSKVSGNLIGHSVVPSIMDAFSSSIFPSPSLGFRPRINTWVENNTGQLLPAYKDPCEINYMKPNAHLSRAANPALMGVDTRPAGWYHRWTENEKRGFLGIKTEIETEATLIAESKAIMEKSSGILTGIHMLPTIETKPPSLLPVFNAIQAQIDREIEASPAAREFNAQLKKQESLNYEPILLNKKRRVRGHIDTPHEPWGVHADFTLELIKNQHESASPIISKIKHRIGSDGEIISEDISFRWWGEKFSFSYNGSDD